MSYVHFKSAFNVNFDKVTFDGVSLTLGQLKKLISEKSKLVKQVDYDLELSNADTGQGKYKKKTKRNSIIKYLLKIIKKK